MAKFRQNHNTPNKRGQKRAGFFYGKLVIFTAILASMALGGAKLISGFDTSSLESSDLIITPGSTDPNDLAQSSTGNVVNHKYYTVSYNERHEIPEWIAYELTAASLKVKNVKRAKRFLVDQSVKGRSASHGDYINSGYTRGHMAPAGDMAFSEEAMRESFYMSNMAPQLRVFNNGIWKELEEQTRDWAYADKRLYIVTGPVTTDIKTWVGKNEVGVPKYFYKALLDMESPKQKGIAFLIPHEKSEKHLREYAMSIDELESILEFELYDGLLEDDVEQRIESTYNIRDWKFSEKRFRARVEKWNKQ